MKCHIIINSIFVLAAVPVCAFAAAKEAPSSGVAQKCYAVYETKNYAETMRVCTEAAQQKDAHASYILGQLYEKGQGVPQDLVAAAKWYQPAADAGYPPAQYRIAVGYAAGMGGFTKDEAKALEWLKRAAKNGDKRSQKYLAAGYEKGGVLGLVKDDVQARYWREQAEKNPN